MLTTIRQASIQPSEEGDSALSFSLIIPDGVPKSLHGPPEVDSNETELEKLILRL